MSIKNQKRQHERNWYNRKSGIDGEGFYDLSYLLSAFYAGKILTLNVELQLANKVLIKQDSYENLEKIGTNNFYPLDIRVSKEELKDFNKFYLHGKEKYLPDILELMMEEHFSTLHKEVKITQLENPEKDLMVIFSPADTILHSGAQAEPFYAFLDISPREAVLYTESSFTIAVKK